MNRRNEIRVTIEQPAEAIDSDSGQKTKTWAEYISRWAWVKPKRGSEAEGDNQRRADRIVVFHVGHDPETVAITNRMRIDWNGVKYGIESVLPDPGNRIITIETSADVT